MTTRFLRVLIFLAIARLAGAAEATSPKLAVVISVDQLRADYLVRFRPYFGEGGFKRLLEGGADFRNAHYRHALTKTAPGHALILSGVHANVHGVIDNDWLDRDLWEPINSVEDRGSPLVGINPAELGPAQAKAPEKTGRSPKNFRAAMLGDILKQLHGEKSKVFAASNKDRSAILLGGQKADAAYWDENGRFVTSRHYRAELPAWVAAFNAEKRAEAVFGKTWDRLLPANVYEKVQGPDDSTGELVNYGLTRVFPKTVDGGKPTLTSAFYSAYDLSPFTTEVLGEFVLRAITEEKLGRHAATDLLCVSFSQIDAVGHGYGPDSQEIMDAMLRLDRVLAAIMAKIDRELGLAQCVFVLTADHGVARMPERMGSAPAGRVKLADLDPVVKKALDTKFGALPSGETWMTRDSSAYHLVPSALKAKGVSASEAAVVVKTALLGVPTIGYAFTRDELLAEPEGTDVLAMARRSYNASRGRDVMFFTKENFLPVGATGSTHATPYDYDTHVPIVFFGKGVLKGVYQEAVGVEDIAPTFAALLGIAPPPLAKGKKLL
ncbi:MAG: alkaline phosphatase family protein [Opitutaceae bacterium]